MRKEKELLVDGKRLPVSNLDKIFYPKTGFTKGDVINYYIRIAPVLLPHLKDRPLTLKRYPNGVEGMFFYEKRCPTFRPAWLKTAPIWSEGNNEDINFCLANDLPTLVWAANLADLELHTYLGRAKTPLKPTMLVFDLDPGPGTGWKDVMAAARDVRERLSALKLKSFLKTSGGKGLHVVLPIKSTRWEEAKAFTKTIAEAMETDEPERYVSTATKAKRNKRIFVDYLRNSREATAVAPYSTRARPGAPVSVPIDWPELGSLKAANQYTVKNLMQRLSRQQKDPWAEIGRVKQSLPKLK